MKNKSIFRRVLFNNLMVMLAPLICILIALGIILCKTAEKESLKDAEWLAEEYVVRANLALEKGMELSQKLLRYEYITDTLDMHFDNSYDKLEAANNIQSFITTILISEPKDSLQIYTSNRDFFENYYIHPIEELPDYEEYLAFFEKNSTDPIWDGILRTAESDQKYFVYYRNMMFNKGSILECRIYLPSLGKDLSIIAASDDVGKNRVSAEFGENYKVVANVDTEDLLRQQAIIWLTMLCGGLALLGLIAVISYKSTDRTTADISNFISGLSDIESLSEQANLQYNNEDVLELRIIKQTIYHLLKTAHESEQLRHEAELEQQSLKLALLQKQIDPHMLYNSLSVLRYTAVNNKDIRMVKMIDNMISYYRTVLNVGKSLVTLSDEFSMIEKYVTLNNWTQGKRYQLYIESEDGLKDIRVPHLFLQPFVENSIIHGLAGSQEDCEIVITCEAKNGELEIAVTDNGRGIMPEKLEMLNDLENYEESYGIKNVYQRLKLHYGKCRINFSSKRGEWTTAKINFPIEKLC